MRAALASPQSGNCVVSLRASGRGEAVCVREASVSLFAGLENRICLAVPCRAVPWPTFGRARTWSSSSEAFDR